MAFKVQIGAEELYVFNMEIGEAMLDVPPEYEAHIRALAETHPGTRERCDYEEGLLVTFYVEEDELPFPKCYFAIHPMFLRQPGEPSRFYHKDGHAPE